MAPAASPPGLPPAVACAARSCGLAVFARQNARIALKTIRRYIITLIARHSRWFVQPEMIDACLMI